MQIIRTVSKFGIHYSWYAQFFYKKSLFFWTIIYETYFKSSSVATTVGFASRFIFHSGHYRNNRMIYFLQEHVIFTSRLGVEFQREQLSKREPGLVLIILIF